MQRAMLNQMHLWHGTVRAAAAVAVLSSPYKTPGFKRLFQFQPRPFNVSTSVHPSSRFISYVVVSSGTRYQLTVSHR